MGITIHFKLRFKGSEEEAKGTLEKLRVEAKALPFADVSDIHPLWPDFDNCPERDRWASIQYQTYKETPMTLEEAVGFGWSQDRWEKEKPVSSIGISPSKGWYFEADPGEGSEPVNVGLAIYPRSRIWKGGAFCKTQYAEDFFAAHALVVALLDLCQLHGILASVHDEGGYWRSRNLGQLAAAFGESTAMISSFARKLQGQFGKENVGGKAVELLAS